MGISSTMNVVIKNSVIEDFTFMAPPSKSYTHRAYAIASLAGGSSTIVNPLRAGDTESTLSACRSFGVDVKAGEGKVEIRGTGGKLKTPANEIDVGNSGTTIRLFTSISGLNGRVILNGDESIQNRPMQPLLDALSQLGVTARSIKENGKPPVEVIGRGIEGGTAKIRGDISSQFISSLLIAAPYARNPVKIEVTSLLKSRPYVDVTMDIMKSFGVEIENSSYKEFEVPLGKYKSRKYQIEGDYSQSSYLLALGAICQKKVKVENLSRKTVQGDHAIVDILTKMGAKVIERESSVLVEANTLEGVDVDLGDTPDLLPTVAALACTAKGKTVIRNIENARLKESDRVSACATEFSKFGVKIKEGRDFLAIEGMDEPKGGKVNSHGDHRMVMALAILGVCAEGETVIDNAETVGISFPGFFEKLKSAGAKVILKYGR
jgi:3-phosphoshikimate 1-carboxyvinyltransferase